MKDIYVVSYTHKSNHRCIAAYDDEEDAYQELRSFWVDDHKKTTVDKAIGELTRKGHCILHRKDGTYHYQIEKASLIERKDAEDYYDDDEDEDY